MASAPLIGRNGEDESREKLRWGENKFYTRKFHKSKKSKSSAGQPAAQTAAPAAEDDAPSPVQHHERQISSFESVAASGDDASSLNDNTRQLNPPSTSNGNAVVPLDNSSHRNTSAGHIVISVSSKSRREIRELRIKLEEELEQVRALADRLQIPTASTIPPALVANNQSRLHVSDAVEEVCAPVSHLEFPAASAVPAALAAHSQSQLSASDAAEEICVPGSHLQFPAASTIPAALAANSQSQISGSDALEEAPEPATCLQIPDVLATSSHFQLPASDALEEAPMPPSHLHIPATSTIPAPPATYSQSQLSAGNTLEEVRTPASHLQIPTAPTIPAVPATYSQTQLSTGDALEEVRTPASHLRIPIASTVSAVSAAYSQTQLSAGDALEEVHTPASRVRIPTTSSIPTAPAAYSQFQLSATEMRQSAGKKRPAPNPIRRHLSVSVPPVPAEIFEKEKRTPKANQFYTNSEFLLANDKIPTSDSNKKSKSGSHKKHKFPKEEAVSQSFKSCAAILLKLMKHKYGWVFNSPVDARALGLHDYHLIIKHPMDLGTIKSRLEKGRYKSPRDFAEDVRLTFRNAMTYNPKGQDVHTMAQELSDIFEERWPSIESVPLPEIRVLERSGSYKPVAMKKPKPKAKDLDKRDMTFEEKQKLSTNLQNLPSEKLESIVQIIKKRMALSQNEDEIEVDIDSVDNETLWELDRFVTNYKKSLSKNRRRAELARLARAMSQQQLPNKDAKDTVTTVQTVARPVAMEVKEVGNGKDVHNESSSSSSSSDSGTSSSDSDSDSSSGYGSDVGRSV